jgi:hypothetical protein
MDSGLDLTLHAGELAIFVRLRIAVLAGAAVGCESLFSRQVRGCRNAHHALAEKMEDWKGCAGGVDRRGPRQVRAHIRSTR